MASFFDDSLQQNANTLQSALDGLNSAESDSSVGYGNHPNNPFEYPSLTETAYPTDQFSTENHWQNAVFHSTPDPSLTQDINSWLDDDSNNSNPPNFTPPTIHVHYHPPHDYFNSPHSWENEHGINHHLLSSAESSSETHQVFHSSSDANPYTTVESNGDIRKYVGNDSIGDWVATVHDGKVYNLRNDYLGRAGTDGNVYDEHDKVIGWVDNQGQVFDSAGHHVYDTTNGVVGGAAYLLTIYGGNVA